MAFFLFGNGVKLATIFKTLCKVSILVPLMVGERKRFQMIRIFLVT
jgi:hypothetical protein